MRLVWLASPGWTKMKVVKTKIAWHPKWQAKLGPPSQSCGSHCSSRSLPPPTSPSLPSFYSNSWNGRTKRSNGGKDGHLLPICCLRQPVQLALLVASPCHQSKFSIEAELLRNKWNWHNNWSCKDSPIHSQNLVQNRVQEHPKTTSPLFCFVFLIQPFLAGFSYLFLQFPISPLGGLHLTYMNNEFYLILKERIGGRDAQRSKLNCVGFFSFSLLSA